MNGGDNYEYENGKETSKLFEMVEYLGNKFPQPFLLFVYLIIILLVVAELCKGITFQVPGVEETYEIVSLLNRDGFVYMLNNMMKNFINFPLIPLILVFTMAVGVGEEAGLYRVLIMKFFSKIPDSLLYIAFLFIAINGNIISDASLVLLPAIGSLLFIRKGKNPILAIMMTYAGYLAGLSANVLIAGTDVICAGITQGAVSILPITANINVHSACNWFFMFTSAIMIALAAAFTTKKFVEPRINAAGWEKKEVEKDTAKYNLTTLESRGLRFAFITTVIYLLVVIIMLQSDGWLRDKLTNTILPDSPFINNITMILAVYFFLIGLMYGIGAKTLKSSSDVALAMASGLTTIEGLLVVFFFAAQFTDYFNYTNLAPYIAVQTSDFLKATNFTGFPLLILIVIFTSIINIFIGTVGAKWSVLAPILVPMMALLGYSPAFAQCVYRIGDSITNTINPISVYLPIILTYVKKYNSSAGMGTVIAYQIPYAITFFIVWVVQLAIWYFLNLPLGPLSTIFL